MSLVTPISAVLDSVTDPLPHNAVPGVLTVTHVHLEAVTVEPLITSISTLSAAITHLIEAKKLTSLGLNLYT